MGTWFGSLVLGLLCLLPQLDCTAAQGDKDAMQVLQELTDRLDLMQNTVRDLARQTMLQQFAAEERIRSEGNSGVKAVRGSNKGPDNYFEATHIGESVNAIHDHSHTQRTLGMGEVIAVLNGVEFRMRSFDYELKMASTSDGRLDLTEDIPFPGVPPAVEEKTSVEEQILEMREWFRAFSKQNSAVRDYRKYFKPVLCYLEGAWTTDKRENEDNLDLEDDESAWARYASYTGAKSRLENIPTFSPRIIMSVNTTTGQPNYAYWDHKIKCSPIRQDIPTKFLKPVDDLSYRVSRNKTEDEVKLDRGQRFTFYEFENARSTLNSLIDDIFYEIPGKDNIPGTLRQNSFGESMYTMDGEPLNTGFYHRFFKFSKPGAMGHTNVARGFNDANCWVAQTSQEDIAPIQLKKCVKTKGRVTVNGRKRARKICTTMTTRFSYAIPLEIVYTTPLLSWNPYNLQMHEKSGMSTAGGLDGQEKPWNGADPNHFYRTPAQFFENEAGADKRRAMRYTANVLDQDGRAHLTAASGTQIVLPAIPNVGQVRLRYPIAPVHGEGNSAWKELNALKTLMKEASAKKYVHFKMAPASPGNHTHKFVISTAAYKELLEKRVEKKVTSTSSQGHAHTLTLRYVVKRQRFEYTSCDGRARCWDGHPKEVIVVEGE